MNTLTQPASILGRLASPNVDNPLIQTTQQDRAVHHPQREAAPQSLTAVAVGAQATWQARLSNTLTFELTTREGDRVQISVRQKLGAMQQTTLVAAGATDGQNTALVGSLSQLKAGQFDARIGIHVQGNLNEDELKALQDVMQQVGALAQDFFSGDMQSAVDELNHMHFDKSQLASFDLDMHQRIQVRHSQQAAVQVYQQTARPGHGPRPAHPQVQQLRIAQWHEQMVQVEQSLSAHFKFADTSVEGMMAALGSDSEQDPTQLEALIKQLRQQMADLLGIKMDTPEESDQVAEGEEVKEAAGAETPAQLPASEQTAATEASSQDGESSVARAEANTPRPETSTA